MMKRQSTWFGVVLVVAVVVIALLESGSWATDDWSDPTQGVRRFRRHSSSEEINVLKIDLTSNSIAMRSVLKNNSTNADGGETLGSMCSRVGAIGGINADYFATDNSNGEWHLPQGTTMIDGHNYYYEIWDPLKHSGWTVNKVRSALGVANKDRAEIWKWEDSQNWWFNVVGGGPICMQGGNYSWNPLNEEGLPDWKPTSRRANSYAAVSEDKKTLFLMVAEGTDEGRTGLTPQEAANLLKSLGAWDVMSFDGGGSSGMWLQGSIVCGPGSRALASAITIVPRTTPPSVSFNETNKGKWFNGNPDFAVVSWTLQDQGGGIGGFNQNWDSDPSSSPPDDNNCCNNATSGDMRFSYISADKREGQHTVRVRPWNGDRSNSGAVVSSGPYGYDATSPTVTITSGHTNGSTYNTPQRIEWRLEGENDRSGIRGFGQEWDKTPSGVIEGATSGWLDLPEGTHTLHVDAWDNAGNHKDWTFGPFTYQKVGTLSISTTSNAGCPVSGEVSVNGQSWESWGNAPQSRTVNVGTYTVSFGAVTGWTTPDNQQAIVSDGQPTSKTGIYRDETKPDLTVTQSPAANTCLSAVGQICWSVSDVCGTPTAAYSWDNATYTDASSSCVQTPEGTHSLRLRATDNANPANVREITVGTFIVDTTPPAAPTGLNASTDHYTATLNWSAPAETGCAGVSGYNVYRKRSDGGSYAKVNADLVAATGYTDRVANGVSYDYGVAAVDTFGREGSKVEITNKVIGKPGDPTGDGDIDISDVIVVINIIKNPTAYSDAQRKLADYDGSGVADAADVEAMKKTILGK